MLAFSVPFLGHSWRSFATYVASFFNADIFDPIYSKPRRKYKVVIHLTDIVFLAKNIDVYTDIDAKHHIAWVDAEGLPLIDVREVNKYFKVIVSSSFEKKIMEKSGVKVYGEVPRPLIPIMNTNRFRLKKKLFQERYGTYVSFVGANNIRKGLEELDEIAEKLREHSINVVAWTSVNTRLKYVKVENRFGFSTKETVYGLIAGSKAFIYPSRVEGFGLPPLEAMYLRVPVVYNDAPAFNEFTVGVRIPYREIRYATLEQYMLELRIANVNAFVNEVIKIVKYPQLYRGLVEIAYRKALEYGYTNVCKKLYETVSKIIT